MTNSIPASQFMAVYPGVLSAGGNALSLNSVWLDEDTSIPIGTVNGFPSLAAVEDWYGPASNQAFLASNYFGGFVNCQSLPSMLWLVQYNASAVAAYVRGGSVAALTLAELQAFNAALTVTVNGTPYTTASINLAAATSFSNAATIISAALTTASAPAACTYDALRDAFVITSNTTGTGSTISFGSGGLGTDLNLTQALGAVLSQGAAAATPAGTMAGVTAALQNFASFMTTFQPATSVMQALAEWNAAQNDAYAYVPWDSNVLITESPPQPTILAQLIAGIDGTAPQYDATGAIAAFICGVIASINFQQKKGYLTFANIRSPLLTPNVSNQTVYDNVIANGYSCYAAIATANQNFEWYENGQVSGAWDWLDEYVFQIWLTNQLQLAGMELLQDVPSIPFNLSGAELIASAYAGPISAGVNFGGIQAGVPLTASQELAITNAVGAAAVTALFNQGWYLSVPIPSGNVQSTRGPWPATLFYVNAGGVQSLELASIDVQ